MSRRRTQWIDAIVSTGQTIAGAAAPGTIVANTIISETEMEQYGGAATLIRVIGDIFTRRAAGVAVITHTLFLLENYAGATAPTDWANDEFQRKDVLGNYMAVLPSDSSGMVHERIDLRTKRKLGQGQSLQLASQNHSIAGQDAVLYFHLRCLVLLP